MPQTYIEWFYYYVFPFICSFGLFFSIVSIIIFFKINRAQSTIQIYQYLLVYSFSDAVSLFISIFVGFSRCGLHCNGRDQSYLVKIYELFIYLFLGNIFYSFSALIDLIVAVNRYLRLSNRLQDSFNFSPYKIMGVLFTLSVLINVPHLVLFRITQLSTSSVSSENSTWADASSNVSALLENGGAATEYQEAPPLQSFYTIELNEWSKKKSSNKIFATILFVKDLVLLVLLLIVNVIMALSLRAKMNPNRQAAISPPPPTKDLAVLTTSVKDTKARGLFKLLGGCCLSQKKPSMVASQPIELLGRAREEPNSLIQDIEVKLLNESKRHSIFQSDDLAANGKDKKRAMVSLSRASEQPSKSLLRNGENMSCLSIDRLDPPRSMSKSNLKCLNGYMERRVTIMIICICSIFFLGHFPEMLYSFIFKMSAYSGPNSKFKSYFIIFCNFMAYSTRGMDFFVYYIFNKNFKHTFQKLFCECFSRNF